MTQYRSMAQLRTARHLREYLDRIGAALPFDEAVQAGPDAPLAQPYTVNGFTVGNRFAVLPMEGWDGTRDGRPTALTTRRWRRFGESGAKLVWGGEAVAVCPEGRANPNQLTISGDTVGELAGLREALVAAHEARFGRSDDLLIGLQLTHSGRFCKPHDNARPEPKILYRHPFLDAKLGITDDSAILDDDAIARLVEDFVRAAVLSQRAGFHFVDLKHCHGYLGHEFLSAVDRPGRYGGGFENRTRFLREVVEGIRAAAPGLEIGVRLSAFDLVPFCPSADGVGAPAPVGAEGYRYAFGGDGTGLGIDLTEPRLLLDLLASLDIRLVCITAGSPYYCPHVQRPARFPPSDGYLPPEDPLIGVARQIAVVAELKRHRPELTFVGSALSYLQEWLPHVAQHLVREKMVDFAGLGRAMLAYPNMAADILAGRPLDRKRLCRTFSDCTTAPRNGMVSGCYPLDEFFKSRPEAERLTRIKQEGALHS